jgi:FeS assembly SUF system regulator
MLRISKLADYGTVVMVYLAKQPDKLCNAREIALNTHLNMPTVSKLLKKLTLAKLLDSVRGVAGGYRLQRQPSMITLKDLIYAFDDSRGLTECSLQPHHCSLQSVCQIQGNWQLISNAIEAALASVSLEALAMPNIPIINLDGIKQLAVGVSSVKK